MSILCLAQNNYILFTEVLLFFSELMVRFFYPSDFSLASCTTFCFMLILSKNSFFSASIITVRLYNFLSFQVYRFPESECKGTAFFRTGKTFPAFFLKNMLFPSSFDFCQGKRRGFPAFSLLFPAFPFFSSTWSKNTFFHPFLSLLPRFLRPGRRKPLGGDYSYIPYLYI